MSYADIKRKIVSDLKTLDPERIILFGSFATDKFKKDKSDVDLLIIKNTDKKPVERYSEARLTLTADLPFDIFVLTDDELKERIKNSFFFREILQKGETIYEKQ